ncbi:MAG: Lpg1974 family pore-forming outer membrane protein [Chlamydiales bacterium]|nr:Lpg1974 family pore-forming outer membrane protein [Chlamydiales bacterium]
MRLSYRFLICILLISNSATCTKFDLFADFLCWHATETVDWSRTDNVNGSNEQITYNTISFNWDPGFRVGMGCYGEWDSQLYYTHFFTKTSAFTSGQKVVSAFLGSAQASDTYTAGQVDFSINFNMFDWELGRNFFPSKALLLRPFLAVKGGWINQAIHTNWTGTKNAIENVQNNFSGAGPCFGINSKWFLGSMDSCLFSIVCDFSSAYMWGNWTIKDAFVDSASNIVNVEVGPRDFGAFVLQGLLGVGMDCCCFQKAHLFMKLSYEIGNWFDQYQVFDDGTGTHQNNLILQGITYRLCLDF